MLYKDLDLGKKGKTQGSWNLHDRSRSHCQVGCHKEILQSELELETPLHCLWIYFLIILELRSWISGKFLVDVAVSKMHGGATFDNVGV